MRLVKGVKYFDSPIFTGIALPESGPTRYSEVLERASAGLAMNLRVYSLEGLHAHPEFRLDDILDNTKPSVLLICTYTAESIRRRARQFDISAFDHYIVFSKTSAATKCLMRDFGVTEKQLHVYPLTWVDEHYRDSVWRAIEVARLRAEPGCTDPIYYFGENDFSWKTLPWLAKNPERERELFSQQRSLVVKRSQPGTIERLKRLVALGYYDNIKTLTIKGGSFNQQVTDPRTIYTFTESRKELAGRKIQTAAILRMGGTAFYATTRDPLVDGIGHEYLPQEYIYSGLKLECPTLYYPEDDQQEYVFERNHVSKFINYLKETFA